MKKIYTLATMVVAISLTSCDQYIARNYGGTTTITIPKNTEVISGSFKGEGGDLWVMTKDTITNEVIYREYSELGVLEGKINIKVEE